MKRPGSSISFIIMFFLLTALSSCSGGGGGGAPSGSGARQWTYMVYMGADNNLSTAGLYNLNEMEKVGSSAKVAIVVQAEFSPTYTTEIPGLTSETGRIYVENDGNPDSPNLNTGTMLGNVDMANPATLSDFIKWAVATYPAEHYALVIWDHGSGWKAKRLFSPLKGAVQDETSGTFMSLPDLGKGVADSGVHFDVINFDACLMAMYEVAYEFKGLTDYLVFSEQTEPGTGDPYQPILAALAANPSMTGRALATTTVDQYNAFYVTDIREDTTKSAVDMSQISALDTKLLALVAALRSEPSSSAIVLAAQTNTQEYAYPANHDLYDLCKYVNIHSSPTGTAKAVCSDIMTLMGSVVIDSKSTGTGVANSHGLSIYLPQASETNATDLTDYAKLKCNLTTRASAGGTWGDYIETLIGAGGGTMLYGAGDFALYLYWTKPDGSACDADLDLYVLEPNAAGGVSEYSPWMGQTTPNGFFSQESSQAGKSEEYYIANSQVMKGSYYFLVNFYATSPTCTQAVAHVLGQDPVTVNGLWADVSSPVLLDLSLPIPTPNPCVTLDCFNGYSDWWYLGTTLRMIDSGLDLTNVDLPINTRDSQFIFRHQRGSALQGITP